MARQLGLDDDHNTDDQDLVDDDQDGPNDAAHDQGTDARHYSRHNESADTGVYQSSYAAPDDDTRANADDDACADDALLALRIVSHFELYCRVL